MISKPGKVSDTTYVLSAIKVEKFLEEMLNWDQCCSKLHPLEPVLEPLLKMSLNESICHSKVTLGLLKSLNDV